MMISAGDGDHRDTAGEQRGHVIDNLTRKQSAAFAINNPQMTSHVPEFLRNFSDLKPVENVIIKFPTPAAINSGQRMSCNMLQDKFVGGWLWRYKPEPFESGFAIWISFLGLDD